MIDGKCILKRVFHVLFHKMKMVGYFWHAVKNTSSLGLNLINDKMPGGVKVLQIDESIFLSMSATFSHCQTTALTDLW